MHGRRLLSRGNSVIEFTLVGIPLLFLLISVFEMSRGMWMYHTLSTAVREGARFAAVRGNNCNMTPNNCAVTVRAISNRIASYAVGMVPTEMQNVRFVSQTRTITCPTLAACQAAGSLGNNYWPAAPPGATPDLGGESNMGWVEVTAQYRFASAIAMFWPGAGSGIGFRPVVFPASSREMIQY
jgi:Flp pilus assembly protein TadG